MTKPVSRKMAIDALLFRLQRARLYFVTDPNNPQYEIQVMDCVICDKPLMPGQAIQFDHVHGHAMGGPHEYQNLRPVHYDPCHKRKSKRDVAALAKVDRITGVTGKAKRERKARRQQRPKPKSIWPARKMQSKPFPKRNP